MPILANLEYRHWADRDKLGSLFLQNDTEQHVANVRLEVSRKIFATIPPSHFQRRADIEAARHPVIIQILTDGILTSHSPLALWQPY